MEKEPQHHFQPRPSLLETSWLPWLGSWKGGVGGDDEVMFLLDFSFHLPGDLILLVLLCGDLHVGLTRVFTSLVCGRDDFDQVYLDFITSLPGGHRDSCLLLSCPLVQTFLYMGVEVVEGVVVLLCYIL